MALYRVWAAMETYCYLDIEADSVAEAMDIASATDGGDFIEDPDPYGGDWRLLDESEVQQILPNGKIIHPL